MIATTIAAKEAAWLHHLINEMMQFVFGDKWNKNHAIRLNGDNMAAQFTSNNPTTSTRSRHLDVRYFQVRDFVKQGIIRCLHIDGKKNVADYFTKPIHASGTYQGYMGWLGLTNLRATARK